MIMEDIRKRVESALEKIRPYLVADGGNIDLINITEDYIAEVQLTGACQGCPFSLQTLKAGVEMAIRKEVPEIIEVVDINTK
jgi:Fe-S cluster biogenesis protein NfuA